MFDPTRREFLIQSAGALVGYALLPEPVPAVPVRGRQARKVGLIGAGRQGRDIISELQKIDAIDVAAVCDTVEGRVNLAIQRAPGATGFADYRALLDRQDIDAVVIATPTHLHRAIAIDALAAGKHVYCEAPLAHTIEDAQAIADAAANAATVFQAGLQARANPLYRRTWTLFRTGTLRDIVSMYAQHHRKTSWRFPASTAELERTTNWRLDPDVSIGLEGELGPHQFDVMHWYRDAYPVRLDGVGTIRHHDDGRTLADTVELRLHWADGVILDYRASLGTSFGGVHEIVHGSNGTVRLASTIGWLFKEVDAPTEGWEVYATRVQFHNEEGIALVADATRLAAQGRLQEGAGLEHPPLYYALAAFVRSFMEGEPPMCTAEEGRRATVVGILAHRAITENVSVDVPEFG